MLFATLLSLCFVAPAYSGWLEDMKKSTESLVGTSDEKKLPEKKTPVTKKTGSTTMIPTNSDVKAFGLSWDASIAEIKAHLEGKGFKRLDTNSYRQWQKGGIFSSYQAITGKKLKWLNIASSSNDKSENRAVRATGRGILTRGKSSKTPNIRRVGYFLSNKQGIIGCVVRVKSKQFALDALKKYGKPKFKKHTRHLEYIYPLQGDVGIILRYYGKLSAFIGYVNIPRFKAYDLDIKAYLDSVRVKNQTQQSKDSKDF